jgi:hypothetical protein
MQKATLNEWHTVYVSVAGRCTMRIRLVVILPIALIAVFAGCRGAGEDSSANPCGSLRAWPTVPGLWVPPADAGEAAFRAAAIWETQDALNLVSYAAERFCVEHGGYPASLSELIEADSEIPPLTPCRFELLAAPLDAWDRPIVYESEGGIPKIYSTGPDGVAGTPDDVRVRVGEDPTGETKPIDARKECGLRNGV